MSTHPAALSSLLIIVTRLIRHCGFCCLLLVLYGCQSSPENENQAAAFPPPQVKVAQAVKHVVTEWHEYTGRIDATESVELKARVSGHLQSIHFTAGARVKRGDLLFLIDPRPFQAQLDLAKAELESAQTRLQLAKNDLARAKELQRVKAISTEEYDNRDNGLREALATVNSAQASVQLAKLNVEYCYVRAPVDGTIGREQVTAGNLVIGGGDRATLLTTLVSTDPVYAYIDADERAVLQYRRQQADPQQPVNIEAQLGLSDETDFPHLGNIDYISPFAEASTGTVSLRGVFANPKGLLNPGFLARVRIRSGAPYSALLLPERALATDQAKRYVWRMNEQGQAEYRAVTLGAQIDDLRVIIDGISAQDWIIVEGVGKVRPGSPIKAERITLNKDA